METDGERGEQNLFIFPVMISGRMDINFISLSHIIIALPRTNSCLFLAAALIHDEIKVVNMYVFPIFSGFSSQLLCSEIIIQDEYKSQQHTKYNDKQLWSESGM